jgi:hypothetical protein
MPRASRLAVLCLGLTCAASARAEDKVFSLYAPACDHTFARAGYPNQISRCARPSNTPEYDGYYVGGGCAFRGHGPGPEQGTWGWDWLGGRWVHPRVVLGWCDRCRYQGGTGAYKTDGPEVLNVFGLKLPHREAGCGEGH